ncbi:MAG: dimethylsulfonioproprionate lyase family protein [Alphaproteobacteria bacterium]
MAISPSNERASWTRLLAALAQAFDEEGRPGGNLAAHRLRQAIDRPRRTLPSPSPPNQLLATACHHPEALPIAASVLACSEWIAWQHWASDKLASAVSSCLYTAELIGPDGHVTDDAVRVGLLLSDRATDYPISRHAGEETYLVISGVADWSVDGADYRPHPPGAFIHHPSWAPHGRRTLDEPFLGAWRWSGDLDLSTFSIDP